MFIAHIPVGLALARLVVRKPLSLSIASVAISGAIFPDFDLIRFYVFDNHQRHHHDYWTHIPAVWFGILAGWYLIIKIRGRPFRVSPAVFFLGVFSHLILDSVAGEIEWLWPTSDTGFHLVTVPATRGRWYMSFLTHWTFAVEIVLSFAAMTFAFLPRKDQR